MFLFFILSSTYSRKDETVTPIPDSDSNETTESHNITKENVEFYVQFMRPHEGPSDGGFQIAVQFDPEEKGPIYIRFDKLIVKTHHERNGLFSCWSPEHEPRNVTVDASRDKFHWINAGYIIYHKDYTYQKAVMIVILVVLGLIGYPYLRKLYLRKYKRRRSDFAEDETPLNENDKNHKFV